MRNHKYLFLITISFFLLGFVNIHFSLLAIICMTFPIILLLRDRKKHGAKGIVHGQAYIPLVARQKGGLVLKLHNSLLKEI